MLKYTDTKLTGPSVLLPDGGVAGLEVRKQAGSAVELYLDSLSERLGAEISAGSVGVLVVLRVECVGSRVAELLVALDDGLVVVHKGDCRVGQRVTGRDLEPNKAVVAGLEAAGDPEVVGRVRAQHHRGTLGSEQLGGLDHVEDKGVHLLARLARRAHLGAGAATHGAAVVIGAVGAADVVVAKLNDNNVAGLDQVGHLGKAALVGEGARRAAADGLVDDGDVDVLGNVLAPAVDDAVAFGHGTVAAEVQRWRQFSNLCGFGDGRGDREGSEAQD